MAPETCSDNDALPVMPELVVAVTLMGRVAASDPPIQAVTTVSSGANALFNVAFPTNTLDRTVEVAAVVDAFCGRT